MNFVSALYNSFLWAMLLAIIAFCNVWLEMRLNPGWILGASWLGLFILLWLLTKKKPTFLKFPYTAMNSALCLLCGIALLGIHRLGVVPAAIIREGIGWTKIPFSTINWALGATLLFGLAILFFADMRKKKKI